MGIKTAGEKSLFLHLLATATAHLNFDSLGLHPVALQLGPLAIRWYSLAYIVGIFAGYGLVKRMLRRPGAPMADHHVDDLVLGDAGRHRRRTAGLCPLL